MIPSLIIAALAVHPVRAADVAVIERRVTWIIARAERHLRADPPPRDRVDRLWRHLWKSQRDRAMILHRRITAYHRLQRWSA